MTIWDSIFGTPAGKMRGYTPDSPIACDGESGERAFLERLRCPKGHKFQYKRVCSMPGACPDPSDHRTPGGEGYVVDKFQLECLAGEHECSLFLDMYHPGVRPREAPRGLKLKSDRKESRSPTISLHYEGGRPAWRITVVQPSRFKEVNYELRARLFRMPQGSLLGVLLNLYDVPDQPYFIHRVMDLSDKEVSKYVRGCVKEGNLVAVFEPKGEDDGFERELTVDIRAWETCLRQGQAHNRKVDVDGAKALDAFLEVFNAVSREKGVEPAWEEVDRSLCQSSD